MDNYIKSLKEMTIEEVENEREKNNQKAHDVGDMDDIDKMVRLTKIYFAKARCCTALIGILETKDETQISKFFKQ